MSQPSIVVLSDPPQPIDYLAPPLTSCLLFVSLKLLQHLFSIVPPSPLRCLAWHLSLSLSRCLSDPGWLPVSPLSIHKTVSNEIHINVCVSVCVLSLSHTVCSKPLSLSLRRASFHSSLAQIHALGAAFKRNPVHSPSQSDMGLTRTNRFLDSVRVRDFWGLRFFFIYIYIYIFCIVHPEMNLVEKKEKKMVIWVMIILSTAAKGDLE